MATFVNDFKALDEQEQRKVLGTLSPVAKQRLLEGLRTSSGAPPIPKPPGFLESGLGKTELKAPETMLHRLGREAVGALPAVGATVGGIAGLAGGPMAIPGAALGGAAGEAARQLVVRGVPDLGTPPETSLEAAGGVAKEGALGAVTQFASPYIGKFFEMIAPPLKKWAERSMAKALDPTTMAAKGEAKRVAPKLIERGEMALTKGRLEERAERKAAEYGAKIESAEAIPEVAQSQYPLRPLQDTVEDLRKTMFMKKVNPDTGEITMTARYGYEPRLAALEEIEGKLADASHSGYLSRSSLRQIRQDLDSSLESVKAFQKKGLLTPEGADLGKRTEVEDHMATAIRRVLNDKQPDIAKLNAEFSMWQSVKSALRPSRIAEEFPKESSAWQKLWHARYAAYLAGIGGAGHYGGMAGAEAAGAIFALNELMTSTAWRTTSAVAKDRIAKMMAKGQFEKAATFATRLVGMRETTEPSAPIPERKGVAMPPNMLPAPIPPPPQ